MTSPLFLVVVGDPSGDLHAASLVSALKRRAPAARFTAMSGPLRRAIAGEFFDGLAAKVEGEFDKMLERLQDVEPR